MSIAESLLPGMAEEKRFNVLRGIFAAGFAIDILMVFLPTISITGLFGLTTNWFSARDLAALTLANASDKSFAFLAYGFLAVEIVILALSFAEPWRAVFIVGGLLGVIGLCTNFIGPRTPEEGVTIATHAFATLFYVVTAAAVMVGFIIRPPASHSGSHRSVDQFLSRSSPTSDTGAGSAEGDSAAKATTSRSAPLPEGPPVAVRVGFGVMCLLLIGAGITGGSFASSPPIAVSFRDSYVPGGSRVLVVKNTGAVLLQDCEVRVKAGNGQSFGPKRLGSLAAGEESELGWAELDGWVLEKGETITLSSKGYANKRIVVP
ncbi:MAG: hypothetical protein WCC69_06600 [Pirellulales bacterium]